MKTLSFPIVSKIVYMGYFCAKRRKLKRLLPDKMKYLRPMVRFMLSNKAINDIEPKEC